MTNSFKYLLIILFLNTCSSDFDNSFEANSLITPNFTFSNHLIDCNLKENSNLLNLESFLSNLVKDKFYKDNNFSLRAYFPKTDYVDKFILDIQNHSYDDIFSSFINDLSIQGFDEIASCNFNTPKLDGLSLFDNNGKDKPPLITSEILSCSYNDGYNFGTFKLAIDRFLNEMSSIKIPYKALYLQDQNSSDKFIWINNFYSDDYSNEITNLWINTNEAKEIKGEFLENAQCIKSNIYNSYAIN
jgi:hypothetical protein